MHLHFLDAMAEKAMELIGANLRRFVANRQDEEAAAAMLRKHVRRYRICMGKTWKYPCYEPSGKRLFPCGNNGVANAILLPTIVEYNALADHGRYEKIYNYISKEKTR